MPSTRISKQLNDRIYFVTFTVKHWYYVLDRYNRWNILANSLNWFQKNKSLKIYAFVFMINHIHLLIKSENTIEFVRDFKKYTAKSILENIKRNEPAVLKIFRGKNNKGYKFWGRNNMPELIETEKFFQQKQKYIHENPVKRIYVSEARDWHWSSANTLCELKVDDIYQG